MNDSSKFRVYIDGHGMTNNFSLIDLLRGKVVKAEDGFYLDPDTLEYSPGVYEMRCTGLKDSDGKLIYEGDILETDFYNYTSRESYKIYYEVSYCVPLLTFVIESKNARNFLYVAGNPHHGFNTGFKIAGNIYENKELLDGK
jgi:uncharacterized phage protein (TIGR01671 family)